MLDLKQIHFQRIFLTIIYCYNCVEWNSIKLICCFNYLGFTPSQPAQNYGAPQAQSGGFSGSAPSTSYGTPNQGKFLLNSCT